MTLAWGSGLGCEIMTFRWGSEGGVLGSCPGVVRAAVVGRALLSFTLFCSYNYCLSSETFFWVTRVFLVISLSLKVFFFKKKYV